jgi:amino acid transporter
MVSRATMIVLVAVAAMFVLQVYLAALFEPRGAHFDADTAVIEFFNVANVAVGPVFKTVMTLVSALIAILANAIVSQATTSRLIFSMARDGQIPRLLSAVDSRRKVPMRAIVLVAILSTVIGVVAISKSDLITSIVTFGSLAAYSLLHVAVMRHFTRRGRAKWFAHVLSPILGLATLLYVLWSTPKEAKYVAGIWFVIGLVSFAAGRARRPRQP